MSNEEVVAKWIECFQTDALRIDSESDKGGHDWHSVWTGFVVALGRPDLTGWESYMELGSPAEYNFQ